MQTKRQVRFGTLRQTTPVRENVLFSLALLVTGLLLAISVSAERCGVSGWQTKGGSIRSGNPGRNAHGKTGDYDFVNHNDAGSGDSRHNSNARNGNKHNSNARNGNKHNSIARNGNKHNSNAHNSNRRGNNTNSKANNGLPNDRALANDVLPPTINFQPIHARKNKHGEYGPNVKLAVDATDPAGLARIEWRAENGPWQTYSEPIWLGKVWRDRASAVLVRATDRAGNRSAEQTFRFRIDDQAPPLPWFSLDFATKGGATLLRNEGIPIPTFEDGAQLFYRWDHGAFSECKSGDLLQPPAEGAFSITFRIVDELGNSRSKTFRVTSDRSPPRTEIKTK